MNRRRPTRRTVLRAAAALPLAATVPSLALTGPDPARRRFLFLVAGGGWDPTLVFEPPRPGARFDAPPRTRLATAGGLRWASSPDRPSVDRFFEKWGDRAAIVNGLHTPCLGHETASRRLLTGSVVAGRPDWPALLAGGDETATELRAAGADLSTAWLAGADDGRRCELLAVPGPWDTHGDNAFQSGSFERLFAGLDRLFETLSSSPGRHAATRLEETVVVALSELGRTPRLNAAGGKDHWPFTSALVAGAGVAGGRVVGATDAGLEGRPIDYVSGRPADSGRLIGCEQLGAALLELGGRRASRHLPGAPALTALLA